MSEKSLFFNALPDKLSPTGYDRNYNADDISDWLSVIWENGVVKGTLEVSPSIGLAVKVGRGKASIKGKAYINLSEKILNVATAPTSVSRFDYVVLRFDNSTSTSENSRVIKAELRSGDSNKPTINNLVRNETVYELMLAIIEVKPNAVSIEQANITDTRADKNLCGFFTAIKGYDDYYDAVVQEFDSTITLSGSASSVTTTIPANLYNQKYSLVEVYTNGLREDKKNYTVSLNNFINITFTTPKTNGAIINVVLSNMIDGEGMNTAIGSYNQWVQDVNTLKLANEFNYFCNGTNDNVLITNLVNDFIVKNQSYYQTIKLNIIGKMGITAPVQGDGTIANAYKIFNFTEGAGNKKISLDFSNAYNFIVKATPSKITEIFSGGNCEIIGATIVANEKTVNTTIRAFSEHKRWRVVKCNFYIFAYENAKLGYFGNFIDSKATITNEVGNSYCFYPKEGGVLQINGGEYTAYTKTSSNVAAVIGQYENTTTIINNMSAPTLNKTGYVQTHSINQSSGDLTCFGLLSSLPNVKNAQAQLIGTINKSVFNQVW